MMLLLKRFWLWFNDLHWGVRFAFYLLLAYLIGMLHGWYVTK